VSGRPPADVEVISVRIGEMKVAEAPAVLVAVGIGSCVAVTLRDRDRGTGGMAHVMLPWLPRRPREGTNRLKYADFAIEGMVEEILGRGGATGRLAAKLVGGAHMFRMSRNAVLDIGARNLEACRRKLRQLEIPILAEDVGGSWGRSIELSLTDGSVLVRSIRREVTLL
jgi:chemotaxis protein CheD